MIALIVHRHLLASLFSLKTTIVLSELFGTTAVASFALAPDMGQPEFMWIWRGVIVASLVLNLHFLRKVYFKVGRVDTHTSQIATLIIAIEYMATEAIENGAHRSTDKLILTLLENAKKLQPPPEDSR